MKPADVTLAADLEWQTRPQLSDSALDGLAEWLISLASEDSPTINQPST